MKALVCGGRNYNNHKILNAALNKFHRDLNINCIIEGGARGADKLANTWATSNGINTETYPANWNKYGKRAGYLRNVQMAEEGKPDLIIAFPGGIGTNMMINIGREKMIRTFMVKESRTAKGNTLYFSVRKVT